jgi:hypothetical protein
VLGVVVDETPPATLTADRIYPKDARLLAEVQAALARGHRVWIYANYTGVHDQLDRAAALLERAGIRTRILAPTVDRQAREAWIAQALADDIRVCLSHPQIVETGLDLLGFPTLIWLSTGYNLMRLRQASRRAWRIGQTAPCRVLFLAYEDTLQQDALVLMGRKLEAAFALEGQLSLEGLQSLAADTSDNDLARALAYGLDGVTADAHTLWAAAAPPAFAQPPSPALPAVFPADPVAAAPVAKPPRIPVVVIPPSPQTVRRVLANQLGWDWDAAP